MKAKMKVEIKWSPNFAYALGLLATDGSLSIDNRHIDFTSKDIEQIKNFMQCLKIEVAVGYKKSGTSSSITARIQFSDVNFYRFLESIGFMPRKSKIIREIKIPDIYFRDFLRGHFDGDGSFYPYYDKRWKSSFIFYTSFTSASKIHIMWIQKKINALVGIHGYIDAPPSISVIQLKYAKRESLKLLPYMYYNEKVVCLSRKRNKIKAAMRKCAGGEMGNTLP
ncbi:MAG: hypothetical protein COV41_02830 [Candidatus Brennerbacteria bacterium CG11_big_fil_rev_8_21_14_0_20_43_10]|uniref:DOD-type homing endonuclease domain-containing protein n=3 Tax=Candidatus Brenneribacteriota TaxID=1817902 RepID=A0A2M8C3N9_9BACT|nr:MAG: hypothetical protein COX12_01850 [Candidatus Brennerbacteria bacterium CG23_combo_of_CG06-09_8_20_14_all_44_41]PIR25419.1 MAG: hypothetical protein COV41_02830 [Candidatus Brennerbacteria bacterium CG11_big_fil_rev_8_21_14_0_20_43_10]PIX29350.1 MAG: hypothetical protein COZ64_00300 [Candidatus Brennerbacteria bacterium CG_4_8_14_3_um_filter_43_14]PJA19443.1 MAG: hypothetical protein COX61_01140 [Candidatus Brennerbacteria bacterium CG_4_10_14_0_2_um_filter_43_14]PJB50706.1 MAG: hypothet